MIPFSHIKLKIMHQKLGKKNKKTKGTKGHQYILDWRSGSRRRSWNTSSAAWPVLLAAARCYPPKRHTLGCNWRACWHTSSYTRWMNSHSHKQSYTTAWSPFAPFLYARLNFLFLVNRREDQILVLVYTTSWKQGRYFSHKINQEILMFWQNMIHPSITSELFWRIPESRRGDF